MALRGRNIENFDDSFLGAWSRGLPICVSSISIQKSSIDWPQQPLAEKMQKFNLIFHDSTPKKYVSKHQNKAEFKNLDDSKVHTVAIWTFPFHQNSVKKSDDFQDLTLAQYNLKK